MYPALIPWRTRPVSITARDSPEKQTTGTATRNSADAHDIILLRPSLSQSTPAVADARMPPNITAPTIQLTSASVYIFNAFMYGIETAITPKSMP